MCCLRQPQNPLLLISHIVVLYLIKWKLNTKLDKMAWRVYWQPNHFLLFQCLHYFLPFCKWELKNQCPYLCLISVCYQWFHQYYEVFNLKLDKMPLTEKYSKESSTCVNKKWHKKKCGRRETYNNPVVHSNLQFYHLRFFYFAATSQSKYY